MRQFFLYILFATLIGYGCNCKEDVGCNYNTVIVHLSYKNSTETATLPDVLLATDFYLYSEDGKLIQTYHFDRPTSLNANGILLERLAKGKYILVTWLNTSNLSNISMPSNTDSPVGAEAYSIQNVENSSYTHTTSDRLFQKTVFFEVKDDNPTHVYVELWRQYMTTNIKITGLPTNITPYILVTGASSNYDFNGKILPGGVAHTYNPLLNVDTATNFYTTLFNMYRPASTDPLKIEVYDKNTGKLIHSLDLAQVLKDKNINTATDKDVDIVVVIDFKSNSLLTIRVNDWENTYKINTEF